MIIDDLIYEISIFEKLAQSTAYQDILNLQNLLKHVPYNFGGKSGTLFGTINLHDETERTVNQNSSVMAQVLRNATIARVKGPITIQMVVNGNGLVKLEGGPPGLIMKLNQIFAPLIQAAIAKFKIGQAVDKDCKGIVLPTAGIKFDWIKFNFPQNITPVNTTPNFT